MLYSYLKRCEYLQTCRESKAPTPALIRWVKWLCSSVGRALPLVTEVAGSNPAAVGMKKSLQQLNRENTLPPSSHIVWHYVRLASAGRLDVSNADAIRLLTKYRLIDHNGWTSLGQLALKESVDARRKRSLSRKRRRGR